MVSTVSILGTLKAGSEATVISELNKIEGVAEAWLVFGSYDFFVNVQSDELDKVLGKIKNIAQVEKLQIMLPKEGMKEGS